MQQVKAVSAEVVPGLRRDFQQLCHAAASLNRTDDTPVPPGVFARLDENFLSIL